MNRLLLYKKAYRMLNNHTPLKLDCGVLCDKACCKTPINDIDSTNNLKKGMLLFPGEEMLFEKTSDEWFDIIPSDINLCDGTNIKLLICKGWCDRNYRPLLCRLFPLFGYINDSNKLDIRMDIRGNSICPLVKSISPEELNLFFRRRDKEVFTLINQDPLIHDYLKLISDELKTYFLLLS